MNTLTNYECITLIWQIFKNRRFHVSPYLIQSLWLVLLSFWGKEINFQCVLPLINPVVDLLGIPIGIIASQNMFKVNNKNT